MFPLPHRAKDSELIYNPQQYAGLGAPEQAPSSEKSTCLTLELNGVVDDLQCVSHSIVFSHLHLPAVCGEQETVAG